MPVSGDKGVMTLKTEPIYEAYSFVCLRCGHAWEGSYEIRHSLDRQGRPHADYYRKGSKVPSPLTENKCRVCLGHRIRILRPGRVRSARPWSD
ncbi:hypothetical protein ABZ016_25050 [Streptomyces sp. NPDC006372]|uniref:hypothetical protein n=1 Tax=Streptomyces sp. NPDC006372 TaxID=3155599 RepID=UPI0033BF5F31